MRLSPILILVAAAILAVALVYQLRSSRGFYHFAGVSGPIGRPVGPATVGASIGDFDHGSDHRLAVLVTDPDAGWLGLARGLRAHGVPFTMTTDVGRALQHKVVFVYPMISGRALKPGDFPALARFVHQGGYLLAFDVEGGGLESLFGIAAPPTATHTDTVAWDPARKGEAGLVARVSKAGTEAASVSLAYRSAGGVVAAKFEDGSPAMICHRSVGQACVLGIDLGGLSARAMNGRGEAIAKSYVNGYEPSLDLVYQKLAAFYVEGEPMPWLIDSAPPGHKLSIILTHDIDFTRAVASGARYADALKAAGVKATFFVQTKYVRDFNDDVFFTKAALPSVKRILADGMEVGSHSVAHARTFKAFEFGTGQERYPSYRPFVESKAKARGGSVLGELRVSKYLLEHLTGAKVVTFRAGHLSNPFQLPDGLAATGYGTDSSITANSCLTHLPFQLTYGRQNQALAPVFEFPVTIEDEGLPSLPARLGATNLVLEQIAQQHGLAVILVHPDASGAKLRFEQSIVARWRDQAWFPSLGDYSAWWRARDAMEVDLVPDGEGWRLSLPMGADQISIHLPKAKSLQDISATGSVFSEGVLRIIQAQPGAVIKLH